MITMEMLGRIRRMHVRDKMSVRAIAKRTGLSRNTLQKWLAILVLLCHKRRRRFTELQCGQCPRATARAMPSRKRSVVIESAT